MKYKNMSAFLLLAITFTVTSFSQDLLSKEEAISQMLVNNFGIKIAENQVEVADNNQSVLNSGYLPTLTGLTKQESFQVPSMKMVVQDLIQR